MYTVEPTLSPMVVLSYQLSGLDWFGSSTATLKLRHLTCAPLGPRQY